MLVIREYQSSVVFEVDNPELWLHVLSEIKDVSMSNHLSILIATFCSKQVDSKIVSQLTSPEKMPTLDFTVAHTEVELERRISRFPYAPGDNMSNLERTCISTLAASWQRIDCTDMQSFLSDQSPAFLTNLFQATVGVAQTCGAQARNNQRDNYFVTWGYNGARDAAKKKERSCRA